MIDNAVLGCSSGRANSSVSTRYRFTGREYDEAVDLYYYRNRYYDADMGRFLSLDPIGFAGGSLNLYSYVGNAPNQLRDPFGLQFSRAPYDLWKKQPRDIKTFYVYFRPEWGKVSALWVR